MSKPKEEATVTNLPVSIEEEMRKELEALKGRVGALPANVIKTENKKFILPTGESNAELETIILDYNWALVHYPGKWNPNQRSEPDCWSIGRDKPDSGLLTPSKNVLKPYGENCAVCPKNQWGSGDGNRKACNNQRRLLLVGANPTQKSDVLTLYVKPGGLKNYDAYITQLANIHKINPLQAITRISFDPDVAYNKLIFEFIGRNDQVEISWRLRQQGQEQLFRDIEVRKEAA